MVYKNIKLYKEIDKYVFYCYSFSYESGSIKTFIWKGFFDGEETPHYLSLDKDDCWVMSLGRMAFFKNKENAIRAFRKISNKKIFLQTDHSMKIISKIYHEISQI